MTTRAWGDYALVDSGAGRKLERYGRFTAVRPEPQCLWSPRLEEARWAGADATFDPAGEEDEGRGSDAGGGHGRPSGGTTNAPAAGARLRPR